ncbi:hypothetical protein BH09MYX1_BH09MYX1_57530 [soil metagenome]
MKQLLFRLLVRVLAPAALSAVVLAPACDVYEAPPEAFLPQANANLLPDPTAPLVVQFTKPIDPASLQLKVVKSILDSRGRLGDESDPPGDLQAVYTFSDRDGEKGGIGEFSADGMRFTVAPTGAFPINPPLILLIEPGLHAKGSDVTTNARRKINFGYQFDLTCNSPTTVLPASGYYFVLIDVKQPIGTQVRLWAKIVVDPATGKFASKFIRAGRNPDGTRCPSACANTDACRTLPGPPACVAPSTRADAIVEHQDFIADTNAISSFQFTATGCVVDQPDGTAQFVNLPVDIFVTSPVVTLRNARLTSSFTKDKNGGVLGAGSRSADDVAIGTSSSGKGSGSLAALLVKDSEAPPGIPEPPPP